MPTELGTKLAKLKEAKSALEKAQEAFKARETDLEEVREQVSDLIAFGSTTGDTISDYLLLKEQDLDGEYGLGLRAVNKLLAGNTGELVMVLYSERIRRSLHDHNYSLESRVALAVLIGDSLRFPKKSGGPRISLPTDSYVLANYLGKGTVRFEKEPLLERGVGLTGLFMPFIERERKKQAPEESRAYVLVGANKVERFLRAPHLYQVREHHLRSSQVTVEELVSATGYFEQVR